MEERKEKSFCFDDFVIERPVGQGAHSLIYKAHLCSTGEIFALKTLSRRFLAKSGFKNMPITEKCALLRSQCPYVVKFHGTFKDSSNLYFVLEYCDHGDIEEAIRSIGSININVTRILAAQLLVAISKMHSNNVIHKDIKTENILLDRNNNARLTDFGVAVTLKNNDTSLLSSPIAGTPHFVAPELLSDGKICFSSDMWAFGCVLFNIMTGSTPFEGDTEIALMKNITDGKIRDSINMLPDDAKDLIKRLLVLDPKERIGYGENHIGYPSIKNHKFFSKIDWDKIYETPVPEFSRFEPDSEFTFTHDFLQTDEAVIMEEILSRRRLLTYKDRAVVFTNKRRFLIFNIERKELKSECTLDAGFTDVKVSKNQREFTINLKGVPHTFRIKDGDPGIWASNIIKTCLVLER